MTHFQLALIQGAIALIEQDMVDQSLMTFLDKGLNLQPDQTRIQSLGQNTILTL